MYKIKSLPDTLGSLYYGIDIPEEIIQPYNKMLSQYLGMDGSVYFENKEIRDGKKYHITILNHADIGAVIKSCGTQKAAEGFSSLEELDIDDLEFHGIGKASNGTNTCFFIIVKSPSIESLRLGLGLDNKDLHITLAFNSKDVFKVNGLPAEKGISSQILPNAA
jgi:hypothetical protein